MTIKYGDYVFNEPVQISSWAPPYQPGVYAILIPEKKIEPKPFQVIYFGELSNMSERGFLKSHHRYLCWYRQARSDKFLYIATYLMPNSTAEQRRAVESQLIQKYEPICNKL